MAHNTRYQTDGKASTFNLHALFNQFVDELGNEGSINKLDNSIIDQRHILPNEDIIWLNWDSTELDTFTKPDTRFLLTKTSAGADEKLFQDVTSKIVADGTYTLIFKGVIESDAIIDVVGHPSDMINPDDLSEVGSTTYAVTGSGDLQTFAIRFQTSATLSGNDFYVRIRPQTASCYIRLDKFILKEGFIEVADVVGASMLEQSVRYNESTKVWEITADDGASWTQIGSSISGDVYTAIAAMVAGGANEAGISVWYTSSPAPALNFDVDDFTLTFTGDVTGSGTVTNLGNESISITVNNDSHSHTVSKVTDFITATIAQIEGKIADGASGSTDLWSAQKITSELAGKEDSVTPNTAYNKDFGGGASQVAEGNHTHNFTISEENLNGTPSLPDDSTWVEIDASSTMNVLVGDKIFVSGYGAIIGTITSGAILNVSARSSKKSGTAVIKSYVDQSSTTVTGTQVANGIVTGDLLAAPRFGSWYVVTTAGTLVLKFEAQWARQFGTSGNVSGVSVATANMGIMVQRV